MRPHLRMSGTSYRIDETYVKVGTSWKYLYRAGDKDGQTIEFLLTAHRDISAVKRFFKKMMRADHRRLPFSISVDKHASYSDAFAASQEEKVLPFDCQLRRTKYLTNIVEQDHRFIRRRWRAMQCFRSLHTAAATLEGVEALHMLHKGQVKRLNGEDVLGQAKFVQGLFQIAA
jgi:IS6 family transposase